MRLALFLICFALKAIVAQGQSITLVEQGHPTSIRGLSVVNNNIAWISGSKGQVALSINGGKTWSWQQVKGFEQSDFRDIEAFSDKEAIIMSSGTPAVILKTIDGGTNWTVAFRSDDKAYFLDGMSFFNAKHGIVMGDPINGRFLVMETKNGGKTWNMLKNLPEALPNEAAFAASGTSLRTVKNRSNVILLTGGSVSRMLLGVGFSKWTAVTLPLTQGQASTGGFSIAAGGGYSVMVGGNYEQNKKTDSVACYYSGKESNKGFQLAKQMPGGYQSCVAYLNNATFLATGTSGTNISTDGGNNWKQIDTESYNVCQKAKKGNLVLLAGDKGKIALFKN